MRICTEIFLNFMSKTKLLHQNFLLIFQKSLTSNIFPDPKEGVNPPPSPPCACMLLNVIYCSWRISRISDENSQAAGLHFNWIFTPDYLQCYLHAFNASMFAPKISSSNTSHTYSKQITADGGHKGAYFLAFSIKQGERKTCSS